HPEEQRRLGRLAGLDQVDELADRERLRLQAELFELDLALRDATQQGEDRFDGRMGTGHRLIVADDTCSWPTAPTGGRRARCAARDSAACSAFARAGAAGRLLRYSEPPFRTAIRHRLVTAGTALRPATSRRPEMTTPSRPPLPEP